MVLGEFVEQIFLLLLQLDRHEDADRQPDRALVEHRDIARDHAGFFQDAHAAQAGRRRQADLLREIGETQAAVFLQQSEDLDVDGVHG